MNALEPGDFVEALVTSDDIPPGLTKGSVYQVEMIVDPEFLGACDYCEDEGPGVHLHGFHYPLTECGHGVWAHCPCELRPIYRPKGSVIRGLKVPIWEIA